MSLGLWGLAGSFASATSLYFLLAMSKRPNEGWELWTAFSALLSVGLFYGGVRCLAQSTRDSSRALGLWAMVIFLGTILVWMIFEVTIV